MWRSLVAHLTGGQGVAGSNPVIPTICAIENGQSGDWPFVFLPFDSLSDSLRLSIGRQCGIHAARRVFFEAGKDMAVGVQCHGYVRVAE